MLHKAKTVAVVTGASSGLGREFALRLARHGYRVILAARREDKLKELCDELNADEKVDAEVTYVVTDLGSIQGCDRLLKELEGKRLGVFINNAGFGDCAPFLEGDVDKELNMIDVNIKAVHYLSKAVVTKLDSQGHGYLLNVASSAGLMPAGPYMATYYATKAYVVSLTRAIAQELKEISSGVYVGALCPGPVDTEFNKVANVEFSLDGISAKACVEEAIKGMYQRKVIIVPSLTMKLAVIATKLMPSALTTALASRQQQKKIYK